MKSADTMNWETHLFTEKAVLCYLVVRDKVLLIHKKKGLGAGKINAPGGRIEPGETEMEAAIRETEEETGIIPENLKKMAELHFLFTSGYSLFGSVFVADDYRGEMTETDEAIPYWFSLSEIPYDRMWEDDLLWLPMVLAGTAIKGYFVFEDDRMLSNKIIEVTHL
ncbi:MAG: 8-oxo-dGTP diphosphatase [Spirochaetales bacterium]|nr:8-oxo-dGTP diphosphatase [Spirochaetales bacterium]